MVLLVVGATFGAAELTRLFALLLLPPALSLVQQSSMLWVLVLQNVHHFPPELPSSSCWVLLLPPTLFLDFLVLASEGELLSFFERPEVVQGLEAFEVGDNLVQRFVVDVEIVHQQMFVPTFLAGALHDRAQLRPLSV